MAQPPPTPPAHRRGRLPPPQGPPQRLVVAVRVPGELRRRLDASLARAQAAQPYLPLCCAAVIRTLLDKGLSAEGA
jgi:hypothetical protein